MHLFLASCLIFTAIAQEPSDLSKKTDNTNNEASTQEEKEKSNNNEKNEAKDTQPQEKIYSASEEIIVYGQKEVARRRKILEQNLQKNGYRDGKRKGDKVVYRPETIWKPSVFVYDSGWVELKKTPPRFEPWVKGHKDNKWRYLSCVPPFTPMCVRAGGWLITKRRAQHSKTEVIDQHIYDIQFWQEAVIGVGIRERLEVNLPDQLDMIWSAKKPFAEKRKEIIELWATRTCTTEGNAAAEVIAAFLAYEVQESEHPLTSEELAEARKRDACDRAFPIQN